MMGGIEMKIRFGFVSNSSTSSFTGIGWSMSDINTTDLIISIVKEFGLPKPKERGTVDDFVNLVNFDLKGNIDLLTMDMIEEAEIEENELLEYLFEAYDTKLEFNYSSYDDHSIGKEFPDADTLDEYVLKINKINAALKADPLYNFMVKYTGSEPMFINEAWVDN